MRRLLFAIVLAVFFMLLFLFVMSNWDESTFGYEMIFKFSIPHIFSTYTKPIQVGLVLIIAFCAGIITTPFLEALPSLYKSLELRAKNRRIRQLERELTLVREMMVSEKVAEQNQVEEVPIAEVKESSSS